jgi:hypothetical protein
LLGIAKILDIGPHDVPAIRNKLYRVEGKWGETDLFIISVGGRKLTADDNIIVVATGQVSGEEVGGRGHYRSSEVKAASKPALELFGNLQPRYVPQNLLVSWGRATEDSAK